MLIATLQHHHPSLNAMLIRSNLMMVALPGTRLEPQSTNASTTFLNAKVRQCAVITMTNSIKSCTMMATRNGAKNHLNGTCSPKKVRHQHMKQGWGRGWGQILTKLLPTEFDSDSHSPGFDVITIQAIKRGNATTAASDERFNCTSKPLFLIAPIQRNKPLADSPDRNSNPFPAGMLGRKEKTNNSINSTNKVHLAIPSILQHLIQTQLSKAKHVNVQSNAMEPVDPDFAATGAREPPQSSVQSHPIGHSV